MKSPKELEREARRGPRALETKKLKAAYRGYGNGEGLKKFALSLPEGRTWLTRKHEL